MKSNTSRRVRFQALFVLLLAGFQAACQVADAQRGFVSFQKTTLDTGMRGGYGVEIADIDGDGLLDILALATNPAQFVWYKNPDWQKFTISTLAAGNIDAAPKDIDGDGDMDVVLASDFSLGNSTEGGSIHWLENPGNPEANQEWVMHFIDAVPTTHRIKWADLTGDGKEELINVPIIGFGASAPDYAVNLPIKVYQIPPNLDARRWPSLVIDQSLQLAHGMQITDWDGDGRDDILTASFGGVHLFQLAKRSVPVSKRQLGAGKQGAARPQIGASEVDRGSFGALDDFIATIEPWHGNEVVVYTESDSALWSRSVINSNLANGHALLAADLNNDGVDEIVAGGRSEPYQLAIFRLNSSTGNWDRINLDDGNIALSGLAIDDLNNDGFLDIVGIGAGTQNVVYYENSGR